MKRGGPLHCHRMAEGRQVSAFLAAVEVRRQLAIKIANTPGIRPSAAHAAKQEAQRLDDDLTYLRSQYQRKVAMGEGDAT